MSFPGSVKVTMEVDALELGTMAELTDERYLALLESEALVFVDSNGYLRSGPAQYPIATSREQLDIYIEKLGRLRQYVHSRGG